MSDIRLRTNPDGSLANNPLGAMLTFCPRCGGDGREIILMGNKSNKVVCNCGWTAYGFSSPQNVTLNGKNVYDCPNCHQSLNRAAVKTKKIEDYERLPGGLCEACEKEVEEYKKIVAEGGVHWRCSSCHKSGVIRRNEFADAVRRAHKMDQPDSAGVFAACGVEFSRADCPACSTVVKEGE